MFHFWLLRHCHSPHMPHLKKLPLKFDKKCCAAFEQLKEEFTCAPVLTKWVPDFKMMVETDTSDYALAAIISSRTSNGKIHPIAFHSHSFNSAELNYNTHSKELLTIFEAFKHWQQYLKGSRTLIDIITNHNILLPPRSSLTGKPVGQSISHSSTWLSISTLEK